MKSWLLDHRPQADRRSCTWSRSPFFFFIGGFGGDADPAGTDDAGGRRLFAPDTYNRLFTMHGIVMVFFFLIPSIPAVLGNFLIPIMIGAQDLAFPSINLLSWYMYMIGGVLHALRDPDRRRRYRLDVLHAVQHACSRTRRSCRRRWACSSPGFSSILTGPNFIVTIHKMRAPGMTWFRLPLFVWAHVRHQPDHAAGHAGAGHHARAGRPRAASCTSASSTRPWAAIRSSSSTCSGSTRTRPCTS